MERWHLAAPSAGLLVQPGPGQLWSEPARGPPSPRKAWGEAWPQDPRPLPSLLAAWGLGLLSDRQTEVRSRPAAPWSRCFCLAAFVG